VIVLAALLLTQAAPAQQPKDVTTTEMQAAPEQPVLPEEARLNGPYTVISVKPGVNRIPNFAPDGSAAIIISSWVDNGNAWGHRRYEVIIPARDGEWNLVSFNDKEVDGIFEVPHTGEDAISVVKFVWGYEDGRRVALAVQASRNPQDSVPNPAETTITIYSMRENDEVGTTKVYFKPVKEWTAKRHYCNAEMALLDELRIPLSATYQGVRNAGGCE